MKPMSWKLLVWGLWMASCAQAGEWTFAVFGDTRHPVDSTTNGISDLLPVIADGIAAEHPSFVLHSGDLINGFFVVPSSPIYTNYHQMFRNWKSAVKNIYNYDTDTGIPIYPVRGNHEFQEHPNAAREAYLEEFRNYVPSNGPTNEMGLSYSLVTNRVAIIALDEYTLLDTNGVAGYVNQPWLDTQLTNQCLFTVVNSHTPAWRVESDTNEAYNLYDHPVERDAFWNSLVRYQYAIYFCGHIHLYCRGNCRGIEQVVVGNGGANFSPYHPDGVDTNMVAEYPTQPVSATNMQVGFVMMTVNDNARTITGSARLWDELHQRWTTGDVFAVNMRPDPLSIGAIDLLLDTPAATNQAVR